MRNVCREELAWAAGFFDGEGNIRAKKQPGSKLIYHPNISISQKDPEVLDRFKKAMLGMGKVYGPYSNGKNPNTIYRFHICNFEHAQAAIVLLWPFLSTIKRQQAFITLSTCDKQILGVKNEFI